MKNADRLLVLGVFAVLVLAPYHASAQFTFTKVVDSTDNISGQGTAVTIQGQSLSGNTLLFKAELLNGTAGLYTATVGVPGISKILDNHDTPPDGGTYFTAYFSSTWPDRATGTDGANIALASFLGSTTAIYTGSASAFVPTKLVGSGDPVPGHGSFTNVGTPAISGSNVVFPGTYGSHFPEGLYAGTVGMGGVSKIVEAGDIAPGSAAFSVFYDTTLGISGNNIAFATRITGGSGIFTGTVGTAGATKLADTSTSAPDGGIFTAFGKFSISGANVAFQGAATNSGVYMGKVGMSGLSAVANSLIPAPSGIGYLFGQGSGGYSGPGWINAPLVIFDSSLGGVAVSGDDVAFVASYAIPYGATAQGLFLKSGGSLRKILGTGDALFGSSVVGIGVSPTGFDGNRIAFYYTLSDGKRGIAVATIPTGVIPSLSSLNLSTGMLSPMFSSGAINYTDYNAKVPASTTHLTITPTAGQSASTISVNGVAVVSGAESGAIPLSMGANLITANVTAADGVTVTPYTITVMRASLPPDSNGDGIPDLVVQYPGGYLGAWCPDATGALKQWLPLNNGETFGAWAVVGVGDFNGDGIPDLVLQYPGGYLGAWCPDATGAFKQWLPLNHGASFGGWAVVGAADFNGDGIPDLVLQYSGKYLGAWCPDATGAFKQWVTLNNGASFGAWAVAGVGDFNGDGIPDLVLKYPGGYLGAWCPDAVGAFKQWVPLNNSASFGAWTVVTVGDFNGDGIPDLVLQYPGGHLGAWCPDATGAFKQWIPLNNNGSFAPWSVVH